MTRPIGGKKAAKFAEVEGLKMPLRCFHRSWLQAASRATPTAARSSRPSRKADGVIRYNAIEDPLCYPGTRVLRNKVDIEDQDQLDEFEQLMVDSRAGETLPDGKLDFAH